MRVLIAPDCFTGTLTAEQAAVAIADGWRDGAPHDVLTLRPLSDGGPGFLDVLSDALAGEVIVVPVSDPLGRTVPATVLLVAEGGLRTAYVESAQACGLHLLLPEERDPAHTTTTGVGEMVAAAVDAGATRLVV